MDSGKRREKREKKRKGTEERKESREMKEKVKEGKTTRDSPRPTEPFQPRRDGPVDQQSVFQSGQADQSQRQRAELL